MPRRPNSPQSRLGRRRDIIVRLLYAGRQPGEVARLTGACRQTVQRIKAGIQHLEPCGGCWICKGRGAT